jgi:nucleoside-diphosphate-sugar epimerase
MTDKPMRRILVTGAAGQIGSELTLALRERYGAENVIATDLRSKPGEQTSSSGPFAFVDVTSRETIQRVVERYQIDTIYHLAAILSATGEERPQLCWQVNMNGVYNILEVAREHQVTRVIYPSSIAVFGPDTPRANTPQETSLRPTTMYGVTKVAGELLGNYYVTRFGLDVRGIRYPGVISSGALPSGGTTDYAVEIFYEALKHKQYTCFLSENTVLPMIYMPDVIRGTIQLAEADRSRLKHHADFNIAGFSFSPKELAAEIRKHIPEFAIAYKPDFRQTIAETWPMTIDDRAAREEWGWQPRDNLVEMTADMLDKLGKRQREGKL